MSIQDEVNLDWMLVDETTDLGCAAMTMGGEERNGYIRQTKYDDGDDDESAEIHDTLMCQIQYNEIEN